MAASGNAGPPAAGDAPGNAPGAAEGGRWSWKTFRRWRRSRPFWGGLLLILAGAELFFLPLTDVFMRGAMGVVMHMGIGGISGVLIGGVLIASGTLLWFDPAHRTFYAVIGALGGVLSFPATNFGGFFLGLLLAITGGSLAFGWTVGETRYDIGNAGDVGSGGTTGATSGTTRGTAGGAAVHAHRRGFRRSRGRARPGGGAVLSVIVVLSAGMVGPLPVADRAEAAQTSAAAASGDGCRLLVICPSSTSSPTVPALPKLPGLPQPPGDLLGPPATSSPGTLPDPSQDRNPRRTAGTHGLRAYTSPVVLTAGVVRVTGFAYQGVADLPAARGGTVRMMKFTATSLTASNGVRGIITQAGNTTSLTSPSLAFGGGIVLYAVKFSGKLLGVPVTLKPGNAESVLLKSVKSLTPSMPLTMTDVVANQPILMAKSMQGMINVSAG